MKDFDAVFDEALADRVTTRLRVVQLGGTPRRLLGKEWQWFCLCVTAEGCPCKHPFLVPIGDILDRIFTGEKTEDGDEIIEIVLPRQTDVLRQRVSRTSVTALSVAQKNGCTGGSDRDDVGVAYLSPLDVVRAFGVGLTIGKALDELADGGISDYLADKIEDTVDAVDDAIDTIKDWLD